MNHQQKLKAGELAFAILCEEIDYKEAVAWADKLIAVDDEPDILLIELALAKSNDDALLPLRTISKNINEWVIKAHFLNRFYTCKEMTLKNALRLGYFLSELTDKENVPLNFQNLENHWCIIECADEGVTYKTVEANGGPFEPTSL